MSLQSLIKEVFQTNAGRELLDLLTKTYLIDRPVANPNLGLENAFFIEGQNFLIREFRKISIGENNE